MANHLATMPPVASAPDFKLFTVNDLVEFPDPEWLIDGMIEVGSLAVLYGPSKSAKSFAALDWALSVATGKLWHDRPVKKGRVVYIVGEGTRGAKKRVLAWEQENATHSAKRACFLMPAPQMLDAAHLAKLTAKIKEEDALISLVIFDTLATSFAGGEENSTKDMGGFIDACRKLQQELNGPTTVLLVHHTGKDLGKGERGSSALRGAADVMMRQTMDKTGLVTIKNDKQKDDAEFSDIRLRLKVCNIAPKESSEKSSTSCVLVKAVDPVLPAPSPAVAINQSQVFALKVLASCAPTTSGEWHMAVNDAKGQSVKDKTFQNWRTALVEKGLIACVLHTKKYQLTEAGDHFVAE
jgi:hypothetical protein